MSSVGVMALPDTTNSLSGNDVTNNNLHSTSGVDVAQSPEGAKYEYTVVVFGDKPISSESIYRKECISFIIYNAGLSYKIQLCVDKSSANKAEMYIADTELNELGVNEKYPFIKQKNKTISLGDEMNFFDIVITNSKVIVNDILFIQADSISNVKKINVSSENIVPGTVSVDNTLFYVNTPQTEPTTDNDISKELNEKNEKNEKEKNNKDNSDDNKLTLILLIVSAIAVIIVIADIILVFSRKQVNNEKKSEQKLKEVPSKKSENVSSNSKPKKKRRSEKQEFDAIKRVNRDKEVSVNNTVLEIPEPDINQAVMVRIPTADPLPINERYTFTDIAPNTTAPVAINNASNLSVQKLITAQIENDKIFELPVGCVALYLKNIYSLNVDDSTMPKFQVIDTMGTTDYILVESSFLFINPLRFSGKGFKAFSDIQGIEKCFCIKKKSNDNCVLPLGQTILDFKPALVKSTGTEFVLFQKGTIIVE